MYEAFSLVAGIWLLLTAGESNPTLVPGRIAGGCGYLVVAGAIASRTRFASWAWLALHVAIVVWATSRLFEYGATGQHLRFFGGTALAVLGVFPLRADVSV